MLDKFNSNSWKNRTLVRELYSDREMILVWAGSVLGVIVSEFFVSSLQFVASKVSTWSFLDWFLWIVVICAISLGFSISLFLFLGIVAAFNSRVLTPINRFLYLSQARLRFKMRRLL